MVAHCNQFLTFNTKNLSTLELRARDRSPRTFAIRITSERCGPAAVRRIGLSHPDHPEGGPRVGARHDARPRRRARPHLDPQPAAHLPRHRRARRQAAHHPHRASRRTGPGPRHPRPHPRGTAPGQEMARRTRRPPARRPHRIARQAVPAPPRRARQPALARRPARYVRPHHRRPHVVRRRRRPRRPVASRERPGRPPVPRPGPASARASRRRADRRCSSAPATSCTA